jgi:hypothetical protein
MTLVCSNTQHMANSVTQFTAIKCIKMKIPNRFFLANTLTMSMLAHQITYGLLAFI